MIKNIYVFGATSAIAQETMKNFAKDKCNFFLVARDLEKLNIIEKDLRSRGAENIGTFQCDALDWEKHEESIQKADEFLNGIDVVLIAHGTLPDNEAIRNDSEAVVREFNINCTSIISLCTNAAKYFEEKGYGTIAVISSVAGERGRQSNFIYGSAKSGVSAYLSGLRNRLFEKKIKVITIKPGMVDTPMTEDMPKGMLFAKASAVGKDIYKAIKTGKDVVYTPGLWKYIMLIIKMIPESIFKKLKL